MAHAQNAGNQPLTLALEEIVVTATSRTYNNSVVTEQMIHQQTPLTSALAVIDNLPGVSIQEGDTFGFDDWSTTISVRGFQVYNAGRPHSSLGGKTPAEAYTAGQPVDMVDKADALPTSPQAQQQQSDMIKRILAA